MFSLSVDTSEFRRMANAELANLRRGCELAVEVAGKAGEDIARGAAPVRSGELRDKVRFRLIAAGDRGARGELRADAKHSSFVAGGTKAHAIEARRKRFLRFVGAGGLTYRRRVWHPGTAPNPFWSAAVEVVEIRLIRAGQNVADGVAARMSR